MPIGSNTRVLARNHKIINQLLREAKSVWKAAKGDSIIIYSSNTNNEWQFVASRPKRPMSSIVLDAGIKERILDDAKDFLNSKKWYADRGIPFRRGYLLVSLSWNCRDLLRLLTQPVQHGAPGTGKTSIIHSLAGELGLDVFIISLSRSNLDDNTLQELISYLPEKCIALMEDIDAAFHQSINRALEKPQTTVATGKEEPGSPQHSTSRITLSGLLNALDGVGAQEGRLLFATTNRCEALDPALRRPGRMDVHVEFKLASQYQAAELFKRFYSPESITPNKVKGASDEGKNGKDTGYSSPIREKLVDVELSPSPRKELDATELALLSETFKVNVPDREISMASLQGFLMRYKDRPRDAIGCVGGWVREERGEGNEIECTLEPPLQGDTWADVQTMTIEPHALNTNQ